MPQSREFSSSLLVWNIVTSPLNELMSLMGSWPIAGYSLLYPCIFALQVAQQLVGTQFLLLYNERHCKSSLWPTNTAQRPMNEPWIQTYSVWYWLLGHCMLHISTSQASENNILNCQHTWRCSNNLVIQVIPRNIR